MIRYVVDASIALKWLVPEEDSALAERLLGSGAELLGPDLLFAEVCNALWKRVTRGLLLPDHAQSAATQLRSAPIRVHGTAPLLNDALAIAVQHGRTVYDSMYVALASREQGRLVTADRKLYNALQPTPLAAHLLWVEDVP